MVNLTLEKTKSDYERFLVQLKDYLQNFPQVINWQFECPQSFKAESIPKEKLCSDLPCELSDSERTNILEAINLALFNLNNEEIDLNLRTTGT